MKSLASFSFSLKSIAIRKSKLLLQDQDIDLLQGVGNLAANFASLNIGKSHTLHTIATDAKKIVVSDAVISNAVQNLSLLNDHFTQRIEKVKSGQFDESVVRLYLARNYFDRLKTCINDKDIGAEQLNSSSITRLLDVVLLGNSSERVEEHIKLFGPTLTQSRLQDCFYSLLEPEVEACSSLLLKQNGLHKHHLKKIPNFAKSYLLDKAEVNMKTRCVLAWSDPTYTGFKPLPDEHTVPVEDLIKSRNLYFKECTGIGKQFVNDVITDRKQFYDTKLENRITLIKGAIFLVSTCVLDWIVCSL